MAFLSKTLQKSHLQVAFLECFTVLLLLGPELPGDGDDADELVGVEGGSADQGAVYLGLGDELGYVLGVDAAAVQDAHSLGCRLAVEQGDRVTYVAYHLVGPFS